MGNKVKPKTTDQEPLGGTVYEWASFALERIRETLAAGAEPPTFNQQSPWHWIYLAGVIEHDQELHARVRIDIQDREVRWL